MVDELEMALPEAWATPRPANETAANQTGANQTSNDAGPASGRTRGGRAMERFDYDPTTRVLRIEWSSGNVYEIDDVPPPIAEGLADAKSKGRYFQEWIRDRYPHRKLT